MTLDEMYIYYGRNWSKLVRELKIGNTTCRLWRERGNIPIRSQMILEKRTNGLFRASLNDADIVHDLRASMSKDNFNELKTIIKTNLMAFNGKPVTPYMIEELLTRIEEMTLSEVVVIKIETQEDEINEE